VSKMEGKTNVSRRLKQVDGLTWLTLTRLILRQIYATAKWVGSWDTIGLVAVLWVTRQRHCRCISTCSGSCSPTCEPSKPYSSRFSWISAQHGQHRCAATSVHMLPCRRRCCLIRQRSTGPICTRKQWPTATLYTEQP